MVGISQFPDEEEVLIYPYVPFQILSYVKKKNETSGKMQIEVELDEIGDGYKTDDNETSYHGWGSLFDAVW